MNSNQVVLWKTPEVRLPTWFQEYDWEAGLEVRSATLFSKDDQGLSVKTLNQIDITISSAERAILEYLYDIPKREGFDEANYDYLSCGRTPCSSYWRVASQYA